MGLHVCTCVQVCGCDPVYCPYYNYMYITTECSIGEEYIIDCVFNLAM